MEEHGPEDARCVPHTAPQTPPLRAVPVQDSHAPFVSPRTRARAVRCSGPRCSSEPRATSLRQLHPKLLTWPPPLLLRYTVRGRMLGSRHLQCYVPRMTVHAPTSASPSHSTSAREARAPLLHHFWYSHNAHRHHRLLRRARGLALVLRQYKRGHSGRRATGRDAAVWFVVCILVGQGGVVSRAVIHVVVGDGFRIPLAIPLGLPHEYGILQPTRFHILLSSKRWPALPWDQYASCHPPTLEIYQRCTAPHTCLTSYGPLSRPRPQPPRRLFENPCITQVLVRAARAASFLFLHFHRAQSTDTHALPATLTTKRPFTIT